LQSIVEGAETGIIDCPLFKSITGRDVRLATNVSGIADWSFWPTLEWTYWRFSLWIFASDKDACLNCLDYSVPGSGASVMRKEYKLTLKNSPGSCGDWLVPFSVSAALHAAALAVDLAVGWAKGKPNPRFRSITLDNDNGKMVKPISPTPRSGCLICAQNR
jgi:hypothetical protein